MKWYSLLAFSILFLTFINCKSNKETDTPTLYGPTWELEYLSGPRIAFEGLFPNKKPQLSFDQDTKKVTGNNGCNGYSAPYKIKDKQIAFGQPGPTTMMYCGEGETFFLNTIKKVNRYRFDTEGKLLLLIDDVVMMRFKKVE